MPDISSTIVPTNVISSNVSSTLQIGVPSFDIGGQRLSSLVDVDLSNAEEYSILHKRGNVFKASLYLDAITIGNSVARDGSFINLNSSGVVTLSSNTNWEDLSFSYIRPNDGITVTVTLDSLSLNAILSKVYRSELTSGLAYNSTVEQVNTNADFSFDIGALQSAVATLSTIDSPIFTGIPKAPTAAIDTATAQIATTSYVVGQGYLKQAVAASTYLTANQNITFSGDVSGSGNTAVNLSLVNTGVTAGTYNSSSTISQFTVDDKGRITNIAAPITIAPAFVHITNKPSTLDGYGITNAQPLSAQLTGISGVVGTQGFLKKTAGSYVFDNSTYLTANQNITFSGDVSGSGGTTVNLSLANIGNTGTYRSVTVDAKGRVTAGTNPTTVSGYGLTDAVTTNTAQDITGAKTFIGHVIVPTPTADTHATTKSYVDLALQGLQTKPIVRAATTGALNATYTNGPNDDGIGSRLTAIINGILSIDGIDNFVQYQGVLVKNQTNTAQNGRYYVQFAGSATQPYILIRCGLCDQPTEISGAYMFVGEGATFASNGYVLSITNVNTFRVGIDPIAVIQFSGAGQIQAGDGLEKDGTILNVVGADGRIGITAGEVDLVTLGTAGTYRSVTVDNYGRVSSGTTPNTIADYGLTGTVQPYSLTLTGLADVSTSSNKIIYSTDANTFTTTTLSSFGRSLIDDADDTAARSTLGLGDIATQNSLSVNISGGTINGTTIGASTAAGGTFTTLSATGNFSVDSTTLFVDVNTNAVGIRLTNPTEALEVNGNVKSSSFIVTGGAASGFLKADGSIDSNTYLTSETDSQTLTWNGDEGTLAISNGNSVDLDGRYLQAEADTLASVTSRGSVTTNDISVGALTASSAIINGAITANNLIYNGGNTNSSNLTIGTNDFYNLNLETAGSNRLTILSNGNVGIGTTAPTQLINSYSASDANTGIRAQVGTNWIDLRGNNGAGHAGIATSSGILDLSNVTVGGHGGGGTSLRVKQNGTTGSSHTIQSWVNASNTTVMIVNSAGNVGIGNSTPTAKLNILDTTLAGSGALSGSALSIAQTWNTTGTPTALMLDVTDTASNAASLLMDLRLGGVSRLSVDKLGLIALPSVGGNGTGLVFGGSSISNARAYIGQYGMRLTQNLGLQWSSNTNLNILDLTLLRDDANTLAQRNGTNAQEFRLYNTYTSATSAERATFKFDANRDFIIGTETLPLSGPQRNMLFQTASATRMTILSNGNVGIGTTTPTTKLEITTAVAGDGIKLNRSDGVERVAWLVDEGTGSGALYLFNGSNSNTGFITGNGNSYLNGGNVGIGTGTPLAKLHMQGAMGSGVDGADTVGIRLTNTSGSTWRISSGAGGIAQGTFTIFQVGQPQFTGERFVITNTGNVGIGATTPNEKLTVVGNISATGNLSASGTIESTTAAAGIILKSPNNKRWRITVDDNGALTTTEVI